MNVGLTMDASLRRELMLVYTDIDRHVAEAGPVCVASGRCCRFKEYGHRLYLSNVEAAFLLEGAPPYEPDVSADGCPFQKGNLCTAREPRPLGCRVYYCDPTYQETANALTEMALARLKTLAEKHGLEWRYSPLHHFLNHPEDAQLAPKRD